MFHLIVLRVTGQKHLVLHDMVWIAKGCRTCVFPIDNDLTGVALCLAA